MKYTFETRFNIGDEVYFIDTDVFRPFVGKGKIDSIQYYIFKKECKLSYQILSDKTACYGISDKEISYKKKDLIPKYKKLLLEEIKYKSKYMKENDKQLAKLKKQLEKLK